MELEKRDGKWSVTSWNGSKLGKKKSSNLWKILISIAVVFSGFGFWFTFYGLITSRNTMVIVSLILLFISFVLYVVGEILRESQRVNNNFKFVKNKFKKDEFFDN